MRLTMDFHKNEEDILAYINGKPKENCLARNDLLSAMSRFSNFKLGL